MPAHPQTRRQLLSGSLAATGIMPMLTRCASKPPSTRPPRILLRSSWQSVNIGDIGHTPGALSLINKYYPEAEITLWPGGLGHGSEDMLTANYSGLRFVRGSVGDDGQPTTAELAQAWQETDLYLSGSGSGFPASQHAVAFRRATGKPVGVFGVSTDPVSGLGPGRKVEGGTLDEIQAMAAGLPPDHLPEQLRYIMDRAAFFFCRDTISLGYLKAQGVKTPVLEFGPDAQLGMHIRDEAKAIATLQSAGLEQGKFICVIPRLRYTPYYKVNNVPRVPNDDIKEAINNRTTESDHARLREMIIAYVKATGNKVLACPEMTYQVELAKQVLVDPLPADIRSHVIWLDRFWLPDEAASVYARAQAVVSVECHSPLIAYHQGTPAFYVRQPTDTCKGQMYRDFGAGNWFFEVEQTTGAALWERLSAIVADPADASADVRRIMTAVEARQRRMVEALRQAIEQQVA